MEHGEAISKMIEVNDVKLLVEGYYNEDGYIDDLRVLAGDVDIWPMLPEKLLYDIEQLALSDETVLYV